MLELKTYKNWKEICEVMNWKTNGGTYKKARLKELERLCKYRKFGNSFIIDEIYNKPLEKIDNRGRSGKYSDDIQEVILYMLYHTKDINSISLSLNQILISISMVNENYAKYRRDIEKLSNEIKIDESYIRDFYDNNHKSLRQKVETALNNLSKRKLIDCQKVMMINITEASIKTNQFGTIEINEDIDKPVYTVNNNTRMASEKEREVILNAEKTTLKELNCKNVGEIIAKGKWVEYNKKVHEKLNGTGVKYYFTGYNIVFVKEHIQEEVIGDLGYYSTASKLNNNVAEMCISGAETRHNNAIEKINNYFGKLPDEEYRITQESEYVENNKKLTNKLIVK